MTRRPWIALGAVSHPLRFQIQPPVSAYDLERPAPTGSGAPQAESSEEGSRTHKPLLTLKRSARCCVASSLSHRRPVALDRPSVCPVTAVSPGQVPSVPDADLLWPFYVESRNWSRQLAMGNNLSSSLEIPAGKGPNQVGCVDLMVDHTVQGTFFRLYYPCEAPSHCEHPSWIPAPEYFNGLADFLKTNRTLGGRIYSYLYGSCKIPAFWEAPVKSGVKFPLVIFSHGLGAFRTLYSAICTELASQGFIVAAVEHRDESASATFYFDNNSETEQQYQHWASNNLKQVWMYYRVLKPGEDEFPLRNKQVHQRADECMRVLKLIAEMNSGHTIHNVLQSQFDWSTLKNSFDLCKTAIMGHSFGGATVIETLSKEPTFKCGIALDSWMLPLEDDMFPRVKQPILFINSEKFQWAGNIIRMKKLDSTTIERKMITIRGTVHQSFPDFTFLTRECIGKIFELKGETDPHVALDLSNKASLAFLQRHLSLQKHFNQWDPLIDGKDENLIPGTNVKVPPSSL